MTDLQPAVSTDLHARVLQTLRALTHEHLLFFRVEVGRVLLEQFFAGDAKSYLSKDPGKGQSFSTFAKDNADALAELGLGEQTLRHCILTHMVVTTLPPGLAEPLGY